jgi:NAD(P)H dehydrogenase (quinone)
LDYAEAAAVVLASDGHAGKVYELAGDDAFTLSELAAEVSRLSGKNIAYRDLPEAEFAGVLQQVGLPQPVAQLLANCDALAAAGALFDDSRTLSSLIGRPTTPLAEAVRVALDVR